MRVKLQQTSPRSSQRWRENEVYRVTLLTALLLHSGVAFGAPPSVKEAVGYYDDHPGGAIEKLVLARRQAPTIRSALSVLIADSLLRAGRRLEARSEASAISGDDRWGHWASWIEARAAMPDDCQGSLRALKRVRADLPWVSTAQILDLEVRARKACGDVSGADGAQRRLAIEYPETSLGSAAYARLRLTPVEQIRRARAFESARMYPSALSTLRSLAGSDQQAQAQFEIARILLNRTRDNFDEAARIFGGLCLTQETSAEEACFLSAKAKGRGGDVIGAIAAFEAYRRRYPRGRFVDDALFFGGFLRYETGRYQQARQVFLRITSGSWRKSARWYAAWSAYLAGQCALAQPEFESIKARAQRGGEKRRAAYWSIRCLEEKDPAEAERRAVALAGEHSFDWYSVLLRLRYSERFASIALGGATGPAAVGLPKVFVDSIAEVRALADAGLSRFSKRALSVVGPRLRAAGHWRLEALVAQEIGDWRRGLQGALNARAAVFRGLPDPDDMALWRMAYPTGFKRAVDSASGKHLVPTELIYAFIRKESAFEPSAVSHAHAVGLMQLLPRTARKIQGQRGALDPDASGPALFDPATNIDLGTWYIAGLDKRFGGQIPLVAAAYNAGPRSLVSWFRGRSSAPTDVFVESIPFKETREYVKRLTRSYIIYTLLGGSQSVSDALRNIPLNLDLTLRHGVDF